MIVGCGEWGFRELPMEQHFEIAREFGFRYLEFGIGGGQVGRLAEDPSLGDVREFCALGDRFDLRTPFCCIENDFTLSDPDQHRAMMAKVKAQLRVAADCGATHARLFAGFTPSAEMTEALWEQMLSAFSEAADLCSTLGLLIAIETHGAIAKNADGSLSHLGTSTTDAQGLERLLNELPAEVGFNYDPGNIKAVHPEDETYCLELLDERINYCHLKDWTRSGAGWRAVAIGEDQMDYAGLLSRMSFDGVYLIEYEPTEDVVDGIRRSLAYLDSACSGYSVE